MPKTFMIAVVNLVALFVSSGVVSAQVADDGVGQGRTQAELADPDKWKYDPDLKRDPWKYYATDVPPGFPDGDGGPAPKRSLTGTWHGPRASPGVPDGKAGDRPELTALAQQIRSERKTIGEAGPGGTNDPYGRFCDPFGFPRNMYQQNRAMQVAGIFTIAFMRRNGLRCSSKRRRIVWSARAPRCGFGRIRNGMFLSRS